MRGWIALVLTLLLASCGGPPDAWAALPPTHASPQRPEWTAPVPSPAAVEALAERDVLVLPSSVFHHRGHLRISLTGSDEMLERALPVLVDVIRGGMIRLIMIVLQQLLL